MIEMIDELLTDAREHMDKSVDATRGKFSSVRTGRASPALLDRILVDYYAAWARSGDPEAPRYRKISGTGSVDEITARALEALA